MFEPGVVICPFDDPCSQTVLRNTIYQHDRVRWQRIKRIRDPMYHRGSVKQFVSSLKSAAYIDSSDDDGSETEIEEEDELIDSD